MGDNLQKLAEALVGSSGYYDRAFSEAYGVNSDDLEELLKDHIFRRL